MASLLSVLLSFLFIVSVLAEFDGDMFNKAQFAVGFGKRSVDDLGKRSVDDTFSRAQIPMGFGKRSAPELMEEMPSSRYARFFSVGRRGEEAVRLPSGSRLFLLH